MLDWQNVISGKKPFFLLKHQNKSNFQLMTGSVEKAEHLSDLPFAGLVEDIDGRYVCAIPFSQAREKGYLVHDEAGLKLSCLKVERKIEFGLSELYRGNEKTVFEQRPAFHLSDDEYQAVIAAVINNEIGNGSGANFVIPRSGEAKIANMSPQLALTIFANLIEMEYGNYWTFVFFDGERYLIGATPGMHIMCREGRIAMHPLSGTMRKKREVVHRELFQNNLIDFLSDPKECLELFMLIDEDLKIICRLSDSRARIYGPVLKELSNIVHTYYYVEAEGRQPFDEILRRSLFSPTVTGSPIDSAFRVIYTHEKVDRRFYGAALALVDRDEHDKPSLDSAVLIRTLEIDTDGNLYFYTGSTIVQDSIPAEETQESKTKIEKILKSLDDSTELPLPCQLPSLSEDLSVVRQLHKRNLRLSRFWIWNQACRPYPQLAGKQVVMISNEDDFCFLKKQIFQEMGLNVAIIPFHAFNQDEWSHALPIVGSGPGNPVDRNDPKMHRIRTLVDHYLIHKTPFFAECLGHQILCDRLGIPVVRKKTPYQGTQKEIDLFGVTELVGCYNTYTGMNDKIRPNLDVSCDPETGEIYALRGPHFQSFQFHPESVLTENGFDLLQGVMLDLFALSAIPVSLSVREKMNG